MTKSAPLTEPIQRTLTRADLADELGISVKAIDGHHRRPDPPPHERRGKACFYDFDEYAAWMQGNNLNGHRGKPVDGASPDLDAARLRKENALASKYELEVDQKRGVLVNKEDYRRHWKKELSLIVSKFRGLGDSIAPQLVGQDAGDIAQRIGDRVGQIFNELSE